MRCNGRREAGFTLIEVLVALGIVAIALMAALRAANQGVSSADALRSRLFAGWIAENVLAEQRAQGVWPPLGSFHGAARQGNRDFVWREEVLQTPNPAFRRVDISVFEAADASRVLSQLTGFLARPAGAVK